ncbi:MAG: hypothetical protein PWQ67_1305 [Clostridia bacterium]|jgi:Spy/CpxP family protein refolding chaperone|nr:hypothetical protein [Clostridia bacterium]MDN5322851.1 hypothetical protein [Clostridia bacterium]
MGKKILSAFLTGTLTLTLIAPSVSFAQSTVNNIEKGRFYRGNTKAYHLNLDEETKAKLKEIREQVKEGILTKEQAKEELEKLNIKFPFNRKGIRQKLNK